jgi:hypothetical protein
MGAKRAAAISPDDTGLGTLRPTSERQEDLGSLRDGREVYVACGKRVRRLPIGQKTLA